MVIYLEAGEASSMLETLPDNINIYAVTASDIVAPSYACYYDDELATYLGDCFSVAWIENSEEKRSTRETLREQYDVSWQRANNQSRLMLYGDLVRTSEK